MEPERPKTIKLVVISVAVLAIAGITATFQGLVSENGGPKTLIPHEGPREASRTIGQLDNVENSIFALGSVWASTSNRADRFSAGEIEASVVRIDPTTGTVEHVVDSHGLEPTFAELGEELWIRLADRLVAFDSDGVETRSLVFAAGEVDGVTSAGGKLWVIDTERDQISIHDPAQAASSSFIKTGDFPVSALEAFGHVWIAGLIDGTLTIIDSEGDSESGVSRVFVTSRPKNVMRVPGAGRGDEVWVTNTDGEVFAVSAENDSLGEVREVVVDRPINRVVALGDRVVLLPTWGKSVLVLDLDTEQLLAEISIDSIPVRAVAAHDLIWVSGDGGDEFLTAIDPNSLEVVGQFVVGSNSSNTIGPQQPFAVDDEVWVPNRGDDAFFIIELG